MQHQVCDLSHFIDFYVFILLISQKVVKPLVTVTMKRQKSSLFKSQVASQNLCPSHDDVFTKLL